MLQSMLEGNNQSRWSLLAQDILPVHIWSGVLAWFLFQEVYLEIQHSEYPPSSHRAEYSVRSRLGFETSYYSIILFQGLHTIIVLFRTTGNPSWTKHWASTIGLRTTSLQNKKKTVQGKITSVWQDNFWKRKKETVWLLHPARVQLI